MTALPLTAAQSRLWLERRVMPDRARQDVTLAIDLPAAIGDDAMRGALDWLTARHDAFRVRLDCETAAQMVGEPQLRYEIVRHGDGTRVLLTAPNESCDMQSAAIIERELAIAYAAFSRGEQPRIEAPREYARAGQIDGDERAVPKWSAPTRLLPEARFEERGGERAAEVRWPLKGESRTTDDVTRLAAFVMLLQRYSGEETVVIGVAVDCRDAASANVVGCFTSIVPMAVRVGGNPTAAELLERVQHALENVRRYASLPFERLLAIMQPERAAGRHPLFEIVFQPSNGSTDEGTHVSSSDVRGRSDPSLTRVRTNRSAQRLNSSFCVLPSAFETQFDLIFTANDASVTLRYRNAFWPTAWAKTFLQQYEHLLGRFAAEPQRRIDEIDLADVEESMVAFEIEPLIDTFRTHVGRAPNAIAIEENGAAITYAELAAQAAVIASALRARGIREGDCVAADARPLMLAAAAALAVLECGGALLAVEQGTPPLRRESLYTAAAVRFVLRGDDGLPRDAAGAHDRRFASSGLATVEAGDDGQLVAALFPERELAGLLHAQREYLQVEASDRLSMLGDGNALSEMLLALSAGARFATTLDAATVTLLFVHPAAAQMRIARMLRSEPMPRLRCAIVSGEPLSDALVQSWRRNVPSSARIVNMYDGVCAYDVAEPPLRGIQPIGRALPGVEPQLRLLTERGRPCAASERGLLHVRGRARGVARIRSDGLLELLEPIGRAVTIGGARVQPAELERALRFIPSIAEARVTVQAGIAGERKLVARLRPLPHASIDIDAIAADLAAQFPPPMLPSLVVGEPVVHERAAEFAAPRDPLELQLARIWEELLERPSIGLRDDFFNCGGDSLLAVHMLARVANELGTSLDANALLPDATIERLASMLRQPSHDASPLVLIQRGVSPLPLLCVHPSGGSILCYVDLARTLGARQTVLGLRGADVRRSELPPPDVAAMAAIYADALRDLAAEGPIALAGYSFGGLVAMDIARHLGDAARMVALLDSRFPREYAPADRNPVVDLGAVLEHHDLDGDSIDETAEHELWRELMELSARYLPKSSSSARRRGSFSAVQEFCRVYRLMPAAGELGYGDLRRFLRNLRANFRAMRAHQPAQSDVPVLLVSATRTIDGDVSDHARNAALWRSAAPRLEVETVDANHFNLLAPPAVERVASILKQWLAPS